MSGVLHELPRSHGRRHRRPGEIGYERWLRWDPPRTLRANRSERAERAANVLLFVVVMTLLLAASLVREAM